MVALALMTTISVASLRPSPTMAVYGLACIFLYLVPAVVFLLPTSLVSAELASGWSGGVYNWVSEGGRDTLPRSAGAENHSKMMGSSPAIPSGPPRPLRLAASLRRDYQAPLGTHRPG